MMITSELRRMLRPLRLAYRCFSERTRHTEWSQIENNICWLIGIPDHKNIGDQAIAYAEEKFITKVLPHYTLITITESDFYASFLEIKACLKPEHIIILHGGGNIGNEYRYTEDIRRVVISSCKKNPIILFPQTVYFTKDQAGEKEKKRTVTIYNKNPQMKYFAREKYSAEEMSAMFGAEKVECVPDIVLSLSPSDTVNGGEKNREGILCCLRNDREGVLSADDKSAITELLAAVDTVSITDTVADTAIPLEKREDVLYNLWTKFRSSRLVVTDRLHGMVFAAITNTPCIVFSNYNKKVIGVYEWIKQLDTVRYLNSTNELTKELVEELIDKKADERIISDEAFDKLKKALTEAAHT